MTLDEIRDRGAQLGWTKGQARYLADIIRNALTPLKSREPQPQDLVDRACEKLEACVGTVVNVGYANPSVCGSGGGITQDLEVATTISGPTSER